MCSLQLNSSSHIARSHHHLFPVPLYVESIAQTNKGNATVLEQEASSDSGRVDSSSHQECVCFGCQTVLSVGSGTNAAAQEHQTASSGETNKMKLNCPRCQNVFCVECDIFIHDSLHNCPGCYIFD